MLYLVLFETSEEIFERLKQFVWTADEQIFLTHTSPFGKMLKILGFGSFIEQTVLYKMRDIELSCSFYPRKIMHIFPKARTTSNDFCQNNDFSKMTI